MKGTRSQEAFIAKTRSGRTEAMSDDEKKPAVRGRPVKYPMPKPINDTPENVARAILNTKPKPDNEWEYLKKYPRRGRS